MPNSTAIATSAKVDALNALAATGDTLKASLYITTANIGAATTAYTSTGEVSGSGYSAGGITVTNANAATSTGTTAYWTPSGSLVYSNVTLSTSFDCVLFYNSSKANRAIASFTFGSQTITAGTFTLTMPANDASNALLRLA